MFKDFLQAGNYVELKNFLGGPERSRLSSSWPGFKPLEKLILFKLMEIPQAMEFYESLSFQERYFLFCGFPLDSIAPILENLDPTQRRLFRQWPREFYDRMFRSLIAEAQEKVA